MKLGYKQELLIKLGKEKGYVNIKDITLLWSKKETAIERINTMVLVGYFQQPIDTGTGEGFVWKFNKRWMMDK